MKEKFPSVPVIFLSDFAGIHHQIEGAEAQATVYLSKALLNEPDYKQLIQRILVGQIEHVRTIRTTSQAAYASGSLKVNTGLPGLWWRDKELNLSPDNIEIVHELAKPERRGETRSYLTLAVVGDLRGDDDHLKDNLRKHIQNIRRAFQEVDKDFIQACKDKRYGIIAVPQRGYRWRPDVPDDDQ